MTPYRCRLCAGSLRTDFGPPVYYNPCPFGLPLRDALLFMNAAAGLGSRTTAPMDPTSWMIQLHTDSYSLDIQRIHHSSALRFSSADACTVVKLGTTTS